MCCSTSDSIVTVRVGEPPAIFRVHQTVLSRSSEFLKTKAKPEWSNGEAVVLLPHHSIEAFRIYSKWLYTGAIASNPALSSSSHTTADEELEWLNLANALVLGEAFIDVDFKDTIMDALRAKVKSFSGHTFWNVASRVVRIIYDGTPQTSAARRFLVAIYHGHGEAKDLDSKDGFPSDFLLDLARASLSSRTKTPVTSLGDKSFMKCNYHEHGESQACYTDRKP